MNMSLTLNDRLAQASKKFSKACEQIKLLKQQISEYIGMFTYNDGSQLSESSFNINNNNNNNNSNQDEHQIALNGYLIQSNNNIHNYSNLNDFDHRLARENIRQKIETLQNFKSIFFMYAHQKAEEITKLQCELYGEEAVREAYDMAPPEVLIPATNNNDTTTTNNNNNDNLNEEISNDFNNNNDDIQNDPFNNNNNTDNSIDNQQQVNTLNWTNNVTPQWEQENNQETNNNTTTNQLHLVEYSF